MNRRAFIKGLGAFMILPGAGRIWKVLAAPESDVDWIIRYKENVLGFVGVRDQLAAMPPCAGRYMTEEYFKALADSFYTVRKARGPSSGYIEVVTDAQGAKLIRRQMFLNTVFFGLDHEGSPVPRPPERPGYREWELEMEKRLWTS